MLGVRLQNFFAVTHMGHTGTIYMTVVVTVERAMVVMRPLKAKYICTRRRAVLVSLIVLGWSIVFNIPRCLVYDTHQTQQTVRRNEVSPTLHRHRKTNQLL